MCYETGRDDDMTKMKTKPEMGPEGPAESTKIGSGEMSMPSEMAPEKYVGSAKTEIQESVMAGMGDAAPALPLQEGESVGIAAWLNNKKINGLWSINQNRNSWIGVSGIGWKKLANNSDSAIVALTMLSAHALEKGSVVNYREESDGMIHEIYVW